MGKRTIGVLTKLDLMDHGTNAMDILSGRVYPLKLGFIGLVNRSQQDIQGNKSLSEALAAERDFFKHHPAYRNMANRCGTQFLAKSLNHISPQHLIKTYSLSIRYRNQLWLAQMNRNVRGEASMPRKRRCDAAWNPTAVTKKFKEAKDDELSEFMIIHSRK